MNSGPSVILLECTIYLTKSNRWKSKDNQNVWNEPSKKNWWNQFHQIWSSYVVFVKPGPIEDLRKKFHEKKQVLYFMKTGPLFVSNRPTWQNQNCSKRTFERLTLKISVFVFLAYIWIFFEDVIYLWVSLNSMFIDVFLMFKVFKKFK